MPHATVHAFLDLDLCIDPLIGRHLDHHPCTTQMARGVPICISLVLVLFRQREVWLRLGRLWSIELAA